MDALEKTWFLELYERHVDTVFRVCRTYLHNTADVEDATQNVFLKLLDKPRDFESSEHEKAWLIRVAINHCKDVLKSSWNKRSDMEGIAEPQAPRSDPAETYDETLAVVFELPENQRSCVYLYYYEGYSAAEIAAIVDKPHSTIRNYLSDTRKELRKRLGGGFDE
ncbi:MAG: RNA polymerase sigma factor [Coriobacteriaceae bacterium]|nr:RNA polymerase sigma factor [Coriobacteriaceae bacterium]